MSRTSKWGTVVAVVCGVELAIAVVIGGAGLAAIVRPDTIVVVVIVTVIAAGSLLGRRRQAKQTTAQELIPYSDY